MGSCVCDIFENSGEPGLISSKDFEVLEKCVDAYEAQTTANQTIFGTTAPDNVEVEYEGVVYACDVYLDVCNPDGDTDDIYMNQDDITMMDEVMFQ